MKDNQKQQMVFRDTDFRTIADQNLAGMSDKMKQDIVQSWSGTPEVQSHKKEKRKMPRLSPKTVIIICLCMAIAVGTVFAAANLGVFSLFFSGEDLKLLNEGATAYSETDSHHDVTLMIDGIIQMKDGVHVIFSLINEGDEPWNDLIRETSMAGCYLDIIGHNTGGRGGLPVLSPDGRKLTFAMSKAYIPDTELEIYIQPLIVPNLPKEEEIYLPLQDLYQKNGVYVEGEAFIRDSFLYEKLGKNGIKEFNHSYPNVSLLGIAQYDPKAVGAEDRAGTYIFIRSREYKSCDRYNDMPKPNESHLNIRALVTELTHQETGEVIQLDRSAQNSTYYFPDFHSGNEGLINIAFFPEIQTPEDLSKYAATKLTYYTDTCLHGPWTLRPKIPESAIMKMRTANYSTDMAVSYISREDLLKDHAWTELEYAHTGFEAFEGEITVSPLRISLEGQLQSDRELHIFYNQYLNLQVVLKKKGVIVQTSGVLSIDPETNHVEMYFDYRWEDLDSLESQRILDPAKIDYLLINGKRVNLD